MSISLPILGPFFRDLGFNLQPGPNFINKGVAGIIQNQPSSLKAMVEDEMPGHSGTTIISLPNEIVFAGNGRIPTFIGVMRDVARELERLHELKGAAFVRQLKFIATHEGFHPLADNPEILSMGGERDDDRNNLVDAARKAVDLGYRVYILPNPKDIRTADFIFVRNGIYRLYDLKTIQGKSSAGNRLQTSVGQCNHVLLNMRSRYNAGRLASDIRSYFETNPNASEVLIFKGKRCISIKRGYALHKSFFISFRKKYRQ